MAEQASVEATPRTLDVVMSFSNLNLPERLIATAGVERHRQVLDQIEDGAESAIYLGGYEITPTRRLVLDSLRGKFDYYRPLANDRQLLATRLHQTWPERPIQGVRHAPSLRSAAINCAAYVISPETHRSLASVARLSRQLRIGPVVVYADQRDNKGALMDFNQYQNPYSYMKPETQITPEVIEATAAWDDFRNFHDSIQQRGIGGVVIDNHHLVRSAYADPTLHLPWKRVLRDIEDCGTLLSGVHAAAGRQDSKHVADKDRSQAELTAIFNGPQAIGATIMGEVLAESYAVWHHQDLASSVQRTPLPVTVEIPYRGLVAHREGERVGWADFVSMHRMIGQSLQEFFGSLPKTAY